MHRGEQATSVFTYLHNDHARIVPLARIDEGVVEVFLPDPVAGRDREKYLVPFNVRDQRTLLAFDGDVPWQGSPKGAAQRCSALLGTVVVSGHHRRKHRPFEEEPPEASSIAEDGTFALQLTRRFILMPAGTLFIRMYRPNDFLARYSLVEVVRGGEGTGYSEVTWRNSTY